MAREGVLPRVKAAGALDARRDAEAQQPRDGDRYRTIDLHPALVTVLGERRKAAFSSGLHRDDSFVFCTGDGRPLGHRNAARDTEAAADRVGLDGEGLRLVSAVVEVARQPGGRPETLLRVYAQAVTDARRREEIRQRINEGTRIAL